MNLLDLANEDFGLVRKGGVYKGANQEHRSLTIWPDTNTWWWYRENVGGDVRSYLRYFREYDESKIDELIGPDEMHLVIRPKKEWLGVTDVPRGNAYWEYDEYVNDERGVLTYTAHHFNVETDLEKIIFPLHDHLGRFRGVLTRLRTAHDTNPYRTYLCDEKPPLWPLERLKDKPFQAAVVLVESTWSVMLLWQAITELGYQDYLFPMCTIGNKWSDEADNLLNGCTVICIADPDSGGYELRDKVGSRKHGEVIQINNDFNVDELSHKKILKLCDMLKDIYVNS